MLNSGKRLKESFLTSEAKRDIAEQFFLRFENCLKEYMPQIRSQVTQNGQVAKMIKELSLLKAEVERAFVKKKSKRVTDILNWFDIEAKTAMALRGLSKDDIENAQLNVTRTGRLTAKPVFMRRFD
jgi:hypothetical protein